MFKPNAKVSGILGFSHKQSKSFASVPNLIERVNGRTTSVGSLDNFALVSDLPHRGLVKMVESSLQPKALLLVNKAYLLGGFSDAIVEPIVGNHHCGSGLNICTLEILKLP